MQAASDIFLGWERVTGPDGVARDFYLRQLRDWKGSWAPEAMIPEVMGVYGEMCGWTLARAHARSGDRIAIASYLGSSDAFDRAIAEFSEAYADQNERDHAGAHAGDRGREGAGDPGDLKRTCRPGYSRASIASASRSRSMNGSPLTSIDDPLDRAAREAVRVPRPDSPR